jgi:hypothetical protein
MDAVSLFLERLTGPERKLIHSLDSPGKIQGFLDQEIRYSPEDADRSPLRVLRERIGHCLDGALFAAATLRLIGHSPLILQLLPNDHDDDHMVALYRAFNCWGAIGQSNFAGLRFREPVYRSLRELVMSYFDNFFNQEGEKTMLGYRRPIQMAKYDRLGWMWRDEAIPVMLGDLARKPGIRVISKDQQAALSRVDKRSLEAGTLGSNPKGLYQIGGYTAPYTRFPE